ncbi:CocE/NonD family hydrolase [Pelagibius sp. 7325]|uniref:CocE/NonD family hydrolase n=1 Tax=Pelagibius sp. 7325 TaxID=3131994 RepID=UPI0030ED4920
MSDTGFRVLEHEWIVLADGTRLAARIWLPDAAETVPAPAVLEFLPYRKRDGTAPRDESTYPVFAAAGYAGVRVDIRGSGESEGVIDGEYTPRELADCCEVIEWIAAQPWCSGAVGMMGISWGGFNALQVAALKPAALKAVISIASTVDRFADDIHFKGGAQLSANLSWAATMLAYQSRPPDPELVGERWRDLWIERLEGEPFFLEAWLAHQRRDAFWKHGSICEDFDGFDVPALMLAGWADGYRNTPLKAVAGLGSKAKAIIGPWVHKYPHFAWPKPRMDFHRVAIRFWDRWLKGVENGAEDDPQVTAYILEAPRPAPRREADPGRWIAIDRWAGGPVRRLALRDDGRLAAEGQAGSRTIASPPDTGIMGGEYFTLKPGAELPADQRPDDGGSIVFETDILPEPLELLGQAVLTATVSVAAETALLAARLVDVHPDGTATRIALGVLNLAHRGGSENPGPMPPGKGAAVSLALDACGYRLPAGHRLRLSLSNAYWPQVLPTPGAAPVQLQLEGAVLTLPLLGGHQNIAVPEPGNPDPLPTYIEHTAMATRHAVARDLTAGETRYSILEDTGAFEHPDTGLTTRQVREETWTLPLGDPDRASGECRWTTEMSRCAWSVRTQSVATLQCSAESFAISAEVEAFEGDESIHRKTWRKVIPRELM